MKYPDIVPTERMDNIFTLSENDKDNARMDMDELYVRKQASDTKKLETYNKILGRIHNKIKTISRQRTDEQYCWYVVPAVIIGVSYYDNVECIKFLLSKLRDNGFEVSYTDPNLILVSWAKWVPGYIRHEIKKSTGTAIDGFGNPVKRRGEGSSGGSTSDNFLKSITMVGDELSTNDITTTEESKYRDIDSYRPSGKKIYSVDMYNNMGVRGIKKK